MEDGSVACLCELWALFSEWNEMVRLRLLPAPTVTRSHHAVSLSFTFPLRLRAFAVRK